MNWYRIAAACSVPILLAAPIVAVCWYRRQVMAGTILGAGVLFTGFIFFSAWDFAEALKFPPAMTAPSTFTKIVVYGFVAMLQMMMLFLASQPVERRINDREREAHWRNS